MSHTGYFKLGSIAKLFSFKGEIVAYLDTKNPEEYLGMESVFVEINNKLVPFFISRTVALKGNLVRLKFEDVDSEDQMKGYIGNSLFLPDSELSQSDSEGDISTQLLDFLVEDTNRGEIGIIIGVDDNPKNPLMQVEHDSGSEIIIPFVDEIIQDINMDKKLVTVTCPEGLIDLYLS